MSGFTTEDFELMSWIASAQSKISQNPFTKGIAKACEEEFARKADAVTRVKMASIGPSGVDANGAPA